MGDSCCDLAEYIRALSPAITAIVVFLGGAWFNIVLRRRQQLCELIQEVRELITSLEEASASYWNVPYTRENDAKMRIIAQNIQKKNHLILRSIEILKEKKKIKESDEIFNVFRKVWQKSTDLDTIDRDAKPEIAMRISNDCIQLSTGMVRLKE